MPVSASGDIATRSSIAMRTSSAQSMSSGLLVTSPSAQCRLGIQRLSGLRAHRIQRGRLVVEAARKPALTGDHRIRAEIGLGRP